MNMAQMNFVDDKKIINFFRVLNINKLSYVLIKNIDNELPSKLFNGKDIDILVKEEEKDKFQKIMSANQFYMQEHPLGRNNGWSFLYGLQEYQFWRLGNYERELYIDASFRLSCKSLMPKAWIPLDDFIQKRVWEQRIFDKEKQWWIMDIHTRFAYYLVRCIFDKKIFSQRYISEIENALPVIDICIVKELLEHIFFKYTDRLLMLIKNKEYNVIILDYIRFADY